MQIIHYNWFIRRKLWQKIFFICSPRRRRERESFILFLLSLCTIGLRVLSPSVCVVLICLLLLRYWMVCVQLCYLLYPLPVCCRVSIDKKAFGFLFCSRSLFPCVCVCRVKRSLNSLRRRPQWGRESGSLNQQNDSRIESDGIRHVATVATTVCHIKPRIRNVAQ